LPIVPVLSVSRQEFEENKRLVVAEFDHHVHRVWLTELGFSSEQPRSTTQRAALLAARVLVDDGGRYADILRDADPRLIV
jgi:hypothetical protein